MVEIFCRGHSLSLCMYVVVAKRSSFWDRWHALIPTIRSLKHGRPRTIWLCLGSLIPWLLRLGRTFFFILLLLKFGTLLVSSIPTKTILLSSLLSKRSFMISIKMISRSLRFLCPYSAMVENWLDWDTCLAMLQRCATVQINYRRHESFQVPHGLI